QVMTGLELRLPAPSDDPRITLALASLEHADAPTTVSQLARHCRLGTTRFRARFLAAMGCTPKAWIDRRRLRQAASLLTGGEKTVAAIAQAVGFSSLRQFQHRFHAAYGMTPTQWRLGQSHL
ncbi:MAG: helix-turn-helix transcriptional regulator, partial [Planctomycetota bacterium]